jgi:hypothetical protein
MYTYTCIYIHKFVYMHVCVYIYVYMYVYMYIHIYVYIHIYIYIFIYIGPNTWTMMSHDVFDPKRNKMFDATEWIGINTYLYIYTCFFIYTYEWIGIHMFFNVYMCMFLYGYIHKWTMMCSILRGIKCLMLLNG